MRLQCNVSKCVKMCYNVLHCVTMCHNVLQHIAANLIAMHCSKILAYCFALQCITYKVKCITIDQSALLCSLQSCPPPCHKSSQLGHQVSRKPLSLIINGIVIIVIVMISVILISSNLSREVDGLMS